MIDAKSRSAASEAVARLKALISPPWAFREPQWTVEDGFTKHDTLFSALQECVRYRDLGNAIVWINSYKSEAYTKDSDSTQKLEKAKTLILCAEKAIRHSEGTDQSLEAVCASLPKNSDNHAEETFWLLKDKDWLWGCIRSLQGVGVKGPVCVPVVCTDNKAKGGKVATLVVEALEQGAGRVFQHPSDVFDTDGPLGDELKTSLQCAFTAARTLAGNDSLYDGRWRLLDGWEWDSNERKKLLPLKVPFYGASASGAAARAWWFALAGKVPDEGVVVIAQINSAGILGPVDDKGLESKLKTLLKMNQRLGREFDTVAVVQENLRSAEKVAKQFVRVVDIANYKIPSGENVEIVSSHSD